MPHVNVSVMSTVAEQELERLRAMTPAEKLRVSERLFSDAMRLAGSAAARRNPEWTAEQVRAEARRVVTGA